MDWSREGGGSFVVDASGRVCAVLASLTEYELCRIGTVV